MHCLQFCDWCCVSVKVLTGHYLDGIDWDAQPFGCAVVSVGNMLVFGIGIVDQSFEWVWPDFLSQESTTFEDVTTHISWHLNFSAIRFGIFFELRPTGKAYFVAAVSYPLIVIPMTLLSAYLLLSKPRKEA